VVVSVRVVCPEPVTAVGLNVAVTPFGNPVTAKLTAPLKPFTDPTVSVYEVLLPSVTVAEVGDAVSVNSGWSPKDAVYVVAVAGTVMLWEIAPPSDQLENS
jgi:hypothetical protein